MRVELGRHAQALNRWVLFFLYVLILFTLLTVKVTRRVSSSSTFVGVFSWSACFLCPTTHRTRNDTLIGVISCSASFLHSTTHAEHETTPSFMVSVFPMPYHTHRTRNHIPVGVISCSASFLHPITHTEHEMTPSLVSFRARILLYPLEWTSRVFIKYFSILLNNYKYIFKFPREFGGNPVPVAMWREFCRYGCRSAKITLWETHVHH